MARIFSLFDRLTLIHEAGHAVIGTVLNIPMGRLTITPVLNMKTGNVNLGSVRHAGIGHAWQSWLRMLRIDHKYHPGFPRQRPRSIRAAIRAEVIMSMAGKEAQVLLPLLRVRDEAERLAAHRMLLREGSTGDDSDRNAINELLFGHPAMTSRYTKPQLRKMRGKLRLWTRLLVKRHRLAILAVARAVMDSDGADLPAKELRAIVEQYSPTSRFRSRLRFR